MKNPEETAKEEDGRYGIVNKERFLDETEVEKAYWDGYNDGYNRGTRDTIVYLRK